MRHTYIVHVFIIRLFNLFTFRTSTSHNRYKTKIDQNLFACVERKYNKSDYNFVAILVYKFHFML